jgi:hypothetical protein
MKVYLPRYLQVPDGIVMHTCNDNFSRCLTHSLADVFILGNMFE